MNYVLFYGFSEVKGKRESDAVLERKKKEETEKVEGLVSLALASMNCMLPSSPSFFHSYFCSLRPTGK